MGGAVGLRGGATHWPSELHGTPAHAARLRQRKRRCQRDADRPRSAAAAALVDGHTVPGGSTPLSAADPWPKWSITGPRVASSIIYSRPR